MKIEVTISDKSWLTVDLEANRTPIEEAEKDDFTLDAQGRFEKALEEAGFVIEALGVDMEELLRIGELMGR